MRAEENDNCGQNEVGQGINDLVKVLEGMGCNGCGMN